MNCGAIMPNSKKNKNEKEFKKETFLSPAKRC